jgi:uncharacterized protein (TIGR03067 family)
LFTLYLKVPMKAAFLVMLSACLALAAESARDDAAKRELANLQGVWKLVAVEKDGNKAFPKEGEKVSVRVEIKGAKYTLMGETGKEKSRAEGTFNLDASKKPKAIDFKYGGFGRKTPEEGIYELDGDNLKLCFQISGGESRPKEFSAKEGSGQVLMTWKRERP